MPTYEYVCEDCGKPFDVRASMSAYSEGLSPSCPACGSKNAVRRFSSVSVATGSKGGGGSSGACGSKGFT